MPSSQSSGSIAQLPVLSSVTFEIEKDAIREHPRASYLETRHGDLFITGEAPGDEMKSGESARASEPQ